MSASAKAIHVRARAIRLAPEGTATTILVPARRKTAVAHDRRQQNRLMDYFLRISVSLLGLLLVRGFIYPRGWGHRGILHVLVALLGVALTVPLIRYSSFGLVIAFGAAPIMLLPYRDFAVGYLKARARAGLRQLAERWDTELIEEPESGRWDVVVERNGAKTWVGNVLTHQKSIHPGVRKSETGYMLAFVTELKQPAPFQCSLLVGWERPRYFEQEWRATQVMQGDYLALAFGDLLADTERGRTTGGKVEDLATFSDLPETSLRSFSVIGTHQGEFARVFTNDFIDEFVAVAARTYPYELNVTPSSVNIYTTYCDAEVQKANIDFLEKLMARLEPTA